MFFSRDEMRDILVTIVVMTVIFSYPSVLVSLPAVFVIVVVSFMLKLLAQKVTAYRYGVKAYYKVWPFGTILGLIFMFLPPLKLVGGGSTLVYPHRFGKWKRRYLPWSRFTEITYREMGIVVGLGPLINILLGLLAVVIMSSGYQDNAFLSSMVLINAWMAVANLIPIRPLDGVKVFTWKPWFWFLMVVVSVIMLLSSMGII